MKDTNRCPSFFYCYAGGRGFEAVTKQPKWLFWNGDRRLWRRTTLNKKWTCGAKDKKNPCTPAKKRTKQSLRSFFIQSEGLVWNLTAGEYVIAVGVWHHAIACIFPSDWFHTSLRDDSIRSFVAIPYRNKLRIPYTPSAWFGRQVSLRLLIIFQYSLTPKYNPHSLHNIYKERAN